MTNPNAQGSNLTFLQGIMKVATIYNVAAITGNDSTNLTNNTIALYVGTTGNVKIDTVGGQTVTLKNLASGVWHPIQAKRVYSTDTTALDILGGY
jgi:hypothetical protein